MEATTTKPITNIISVYEQRALDSAAINLINQEAT
jgi:hypothetical protein